MVTILLQTIIELLTGWKDSFFTWANDIGDKIAAIKTNTDSLPDIKSNTDDIKDNTAAVITPISNINTNVSAIAPDVAAIKTDTAVIKNNANAIMTSAGQTAAYAEDIADNTLDCSNRLVTIGSDTTQIRADSGSIATDLTEIKTALNYYLYNTIVTEDTEGAIANFDTDLKDYLQEAKVTIPADVGGIAGINVLHFGGNFWDEQWELGQYSTINGAPIPSTERIRGKNRIPVKPGASYLTTQRIRYFEYDSNDDFITVSAGYGSLNQVFTVGPTTAFIRIQFTSSYGLTYLNDESLNLPNDTNYYPYIQSNTSAVAFSSPITDGAEVDLLSGIVKINTSPITYDSITPLSIRTFKGVNNIYSDIGDIDVTYRETLKHYLEKQEEN